MKKIILVFVVIGISACGKMGELERVKPEQVVLLTGLTQEIDPTTQNVVPELDILPIVLSNL